MGKNTSVVLTEQQEAFIHDQIAAGRFTSVSEAVRAYRPHCKNEIR